GSLNTGWSLLISAASEKSPDHHPMRTQPVNAQNLSRASAAAVPCPNTSAVTPEIVKPVTALVRPLIKKYPAAMQIKRTSNPCLAFVGRSAIFRFCHHRQPIQVHTESSRSGRARRATGKVVILEIASVKAHPRIEKTTVPKSCPYIANTALAAKIMMVN